MFLILAFAGTTISQTIETEVPIPQPKDGDSRYFCVPFDVPEGTKSLSVTYKYDRRDGANVLDLGLFDSRFDGTKNGLNGFRGWSGGRRQTVFVGRESASNGYLPGEVPAGKWRVILGLYKIAAEGVKVTVSVRLNGVDPGAESEMKIENAKVFDFPKLARMNPETSGGFTWFRGDLHTHTFHSDGSWTLKSVLDYAVANGLDYIAVTEHNTKSHHAELDRLRPKYPGLLVLTGEEVTTYGGHLNVWGLPTGMLVDFRVTPRDTRGLNDVLKPVREMKLAASINHPTALCGGCGWTYGDDWAGMDSVEVWNGAWDATDELALKKWDASLNRGSRITAIGSSDSHTPPSEPSDYGTNLAVGSPTTFIGAKSLQQNELFDAIFAHRIYVADRPDRVLFFRSGKGEIGSEISARAGRQIPFSMGAANFPDGSVMRMISNGKILKNLPMSGGGLIAGLDFQFDTDGYVRVEVRDSTGKLLAFTNPIFVKIKR